MSEADVRGEEAVLVPSQGSEVGLVSLTWLRSVCVANRVQARRGLGQPGGSLLRSCRMESASGILEARCPGFLG